MHPRSFTPLRRTPKARHPLPGVRDLTREGFQLFQADKGVRGLLRVLSLRLTRVNAINSYHSFGLACHGTDEPWKGEALLQATQQAGGAVRLSVQIVTRKEEKRRREKPRFPLCFFYGSFVQSLSQR